MKRGISIHIKRMYFMGMLFQYSRTFSLIGGVGRDDAFIETIFTSRKMVNLIHKKPQVTKDNLMS
jgi:hypothetical protein